MNVIANELSPTDIFIVTFGAGVAIFGLIVLVVTIIAWIADIREQRRIKRGKHVHIPTRSGGVTGI